MKAKPILSSQNTNQTSVIVGYEIYCPGCKKNHFLRVNPSFIKKGSKFVFNGDTENPTFTPDLLVWSKSDGSDRCHSNITNGQIIFFSDCTHSLKSQAVNLIDVI